MCTHLAAISQKKRSTTAVLSLWQYQVGLVIQRDALSSIGEQCYTHNFG